MKKFFAPLLSAMVISLVVFSLALPTNSNAKNRIRVLSKDSKTTSQAIEKGCKEVRRVKALHALVCSDDVANQLGLPEDVRVFSQDSGANSQIKADSVQTAGNTGVGRKVAILDTGYNYTHSELSSSYLGGKDFVNGDDDPFDDNGHGSHVAGIITADGINTSARGVAPAAGIIVGKVLDSSGSGYFSDIIAAIYWAADQHPDAISMSLGTGHPYLYRGFCDSVYPDMTNAIKYARDNGVPVVVAAGNSGSSGVSLPGCISYSTTVGAVNNRDKIASFSGRGSGVDITAPGVNIFSSWLGAGYITASGTSMATPMISGVVGLIKAAHPSDTVSQVEDALFKTAKDLGSSGKDKNFGWGRVDALSAVNF